MTTPQVHELRLVVTAEDFDDAVVLYRDVLGLPEVAAVTSPGGRVVILDAGRATLELADPEHAAYIDEVEVGRRVAGHLRVAFGVRDVDGTTRRLTEADAELVAAPVATPWGTRNSRLEGAADLQLTLFGP
ncbi:VOC family protein [Nitriliruptor alkaliphilus]|uniref:VOC family protein n=1 Tax=Nitriliruptor alkaliphilus TaxID=427918 RepID=UPI000ADA6A37|nr:VOC family protein [Nitriliruptor alkaliphilus]